MRDKNSVEVVAEMLYYEKNPNTTMDVPSSVYEQVEEWRLDWIASNSVLSLWGWIKQFKD